MTRLAKNFILATAVVSAIFFVDPASIAAAAPENFFGIKKIRPPTTDKFTKNYLDFWSKFRDTVMPDEPQNNNPPKEMRRPPPVKHKQPPRIEPPPKRTNQSLIVKPR